MTANDLSVEPIGWTILQRRLLTGDSRKEFARYLTGLGFAFDLDKQTQTLRVTKVFADSPASQAKLVAGLMIQRIENVPTAGKSVTECLRLLHANSNPNVRLELVDLERNATNVVVVTRGKFMTSG